VLDNIADMGFIAVVCELIKLKLKPSELEWDTKSNRLWITGLYGQVNKLSIIVFTNTQILSHVRWIQSSKLFLRNN